MNNIFNYPEINEPIGNQFFEKSEKDFEITIYFCYSAPVYFKLSQLPFLSLITPSVLWIL